MNRIGFGNKTNLKRAVGALLRNKHTTITTHHLYMFIATLLHEMAHIARAHTHIRHSVNIETRAIKARCPGYVDQRPQLSKPENEHEADLIALLIFSNEEMTRAAIHQELINTIHELSHASICPQIVPQHDTHPPSIDRLKRALQFWIELKVQQKQINRDQATKDVLSEYHKLLKAYSLSPDDNIVRPALEQLATQLA